MSLLQKYAEMQKQAGLPLGLPSAALPAGDAIRAGLAARLANPGYGPHRAAMGTRIRAALAAPSTTGASAAAAIGRGNNTAAAWRAQQPPQSLFSKLRDAAKRGFAEGYKPSGS